MTWDDFQSLCAVLAVGAGLLFLDHWFDKQ